MEIFPSLKKSPGFPKQGKDLLLKYGINGIKREKRITERSPYRPRKFSPALLIYLLHLEVHNGQFEIGVMITIWTRRVGRRREAGGRLPSSPPSGIALGGLVAVAGSRLPHSWSMAASAE